MFLIFSKLINMPIRQRLVTRQSVKWMLDLDEVIDFMIFIFGGFDLKGINKFKSKINSEDTIVDIGANIGSFSLMVSQKLKNTGRIISIEPSDFAYNKFLKNLELNEDLSSRITSFQGFVTEKSNFKPKGIHASWNVLSSEERHENHCGILTSTNGAVSLTLDDIMTHFSIKKLDWLKIDVDGYEKGVLLGGQNVFNIHKPKIFMELCEYSLEEHNSSVDEILSFLIQFNYTFYGVNDYFFNQDIDAIKKSIPNMGTINIFAYPAL